jgi:hypothetical protein
MCGANGTVREKASDLPEPSATARSESCFVALNLDVARKIPPPFATTYATVRQLPLRPVTVHRAVSAVTRHLPRRPAVQCVETTWPSTATRSSVRICGPVAELDVAGRLGRPERATVRVRVVRPDVKLDGSSHVRMRSLREARQRAHERGRGDGVPRLLPALLVPGRVELARDDGRGVGAIAFHRAISRTCWAPCAVRQRERLRLRPLRWTVSNSAVRNRRVEPVMRVSVDCHSLRRNRRLPLWQRGT